MLPVYPVTSETQTTEQIKPRKRRWLRGVFLALAVLFGLALIGRLLLPSFVQSYVNRTINRTDLYSGRIGDVDMHLWRGAYSIHNIRLSKTTGNIPVPFFRAERIDLALEWSSLFHGRIVGVIDVYQPEINFVDAPDESSSQTGMTGGGGPWLSMLTDLFPFDINSARIHNGAVHFRAYQATPPVDVYLTSVEAKVDNLTNIRDEVTPLISTIKVDAVAMDSAKLECEVKLDPFSYYPTFQLALRLLELDVTKLNALAEAYGSLDFERGWFDLVIELDVKEGTLDGYVKPLFRQLRVLSVPKDLKEDNPLQVFWEAVVGVTSGVLTNQSREQFGTVIPFTGSVTGPEADVLAVVGNVLRNAFIRAYLPRLVGRVPDINSLEFGPGKPADPLTPSDPSAR